MRYISIEVNLLKRLRLSGIRRLKMTFEEVMQLILGSNGSGKSSLLYEVSMLPAEPSRYEKGGSAIVTAEADDGYTYTATTVFEPSTRCKLVRHTDEGDVVLNNWGTASAQRSEVEKIFKMTPEVRNLILGKERLTRFGPGKRREWFMRLNNANYDYALAVFDRAKKEFNDLSATLRKTKERLVAEQGKVVSPEEAKKLQDEVDQMYRDMEMLSENRAPVTRASQTYESEQKQQLAELDALTKQLFRLRFVAPYAGHALSRERPSFGSLIEINAEIERLKGELISRNALIDKAVKEHDRLQQQFDVLSKTGEQGLVALHQRFKAVHLRKIDVLATRTLVDVIEKLDSIHPINGLGALESLWDTLEDLSSSIPDNNERIYGQAKIPALTEEMMQATRAFNTAQNALEKLQARKVHAEQHRGNGETTCPKCAYRWTIGYNEDEYKRLLNGIAVYEEQVVQAKAGMRDVEERIAKNYEYGEKYRSFIRLTQAWPVLAPLWDYLIANEYMVTKARMTMGFVDRFRHDLQIMKDALRLDAELGEIAQLIESAEKLGDASLTDVRLGLEQWNHEVEHLSQERVALQKDINDYQTYYRQMSEGIELGRRIRQLRSDVVNVNQEWIEMLRRETILHCINQLRTSLLRKEETLSYMTTQKARVEDIEEQIRQLTIEEEAARLVVRELSPTEGLIAEGLLGFIQHFVGQMNVVIKRIWSYPLVVQDCAIETSGGTELDYKFPVVVNDQDEPIDDVADGSTGIMEIIDLAFRITAMQSLGLANSPLFLDEFGASFDKYHQNAATMTILNIMEERQFTQLFMVSHYEASYGAMTNADICVLCPSNITVPSDGLYNQHVEMEYA